MAGLESRNEEFARLWTQAQPGVSAFVLSMIPDFHMAEDVLQECAAVLIRKFDRYDPSQPFIAWAIAVARLEIMDARRHVAASRVVFDETAFENLAAAYEKVGPEVGPIVAALQECVDRASSKSRQLLDLRYGADLKPREIAARVGSTVNATTVALNRVRQSLRQCVELRLSSKKATL